MPTSVIERARHISRCRLEGLPIERIDFDNSEAEASDRAKAALVDAFLAFDFDSKSTEEFYGSVDHLILGGGPCTAAA